MITFSVFTTPIELARAASAAKTNAMAKIRDFILKRIADSEALGKRPAAG